MSTLSAHERRTLTESLTEYEQSFVAPRLCPHGDRGARINPADASRACQAIVDEMAGWA